MAEQTATRAAAWTPPRPASERNYPMNCWWVAGLSDEITDALLGRWLCDVPVLLYRKTDGSVAAIENRCPHRSAPLHLGCRRGDNIECGYHGFTYSPEGECVKVPSMKVPPPALRIRSFPVIESFPFAWVYLGDPERIAEVPPPHRLEWTGDDSFAMVSGRLDVAANYMLLKENVLDLTHFGYVHANSFQITDWVDPPTTVRGEETCGFHQSFTQSPLPPVFAEPMGLAPGTPYNRDNYGSFVSPALQIAAVDLKDPVDGRITGRFRVTHATTPTGPRSMHYWWVLARDYGTAPAQMQALKDITEIGFAEDERIIEAVQEMYDRDPRDTATLERSVKADGPAVEARRLLQKWMARETA